MATVEINTNLDSSLRENRVFPPPAEFAANAHMKSLAEYEAMYRRSVEQPDEFWAKLPPSSTGSLPGRRSSMVRRSTPSGLLMGS